MVTELDQELRAVLECQEGNRTRLMELLQPLRRPLLSLFICRALEGKKPFRFDRGNMIGTHVQILLAQRPREKKVICAELAKKYNCKDTYVRHCHEGVLKAEKTFKQNLKWVQSVSKS